MARRERRPRGRFLFGMIVGAVGYWAFDHYVCKGLLSGNKPVDKQRAEEMKKKAIEANKETKKEVDDLVKHVKDQSKKQ